MKMLKWNEIKWERFNIRFMAKDLKTKDQRLDQRLKICQDGAFIIGIYT